LFGLSSLASGVIITIVPLETPPCDPLILPMVVDELGNAPVFPPDELIASTATFTNLPACPPMDNPMIPNALVVMTNLTPTPWRDVHYVGDVTPPGVPGTTTLSNEDGLVTGGMAFKIDYAGVNVPLVFESMAADAIFAPGETWHFIIQDYVNSAGLPPGLFGSIGVGTGSPGLGSSGSIIALPVPTPATMGLLVLPAVSGIARRRRSMS
jgi:hypothetical protein